jgi:uncharacterized membrane protein
MQNLKNLLKQPLRTVPLSIVSGALVIALIGFADAAYLTLEHFQGVIPPCTIAGCDVVLTSVYSTVAGIPVSLAGAVFYLAILVGLFIYIESRNLTVLKWTLALTAVGLLSTLWFLFVQTFLLHAFCQYCLLSAFTSIVLFVIASWVFSKYRVTDTLPE